MEPHRRVFVALDTPDADGACALAAAVAPSVGGYKIGLELFSSHGPAVVRRMAEETGRPLFVDLKLHDIPNTVAKAAAALGHLGAGFLTVHALGGEAMIARAVEGAREGAAAAGLEPPAILAVTVLTSHDDADLERLGLAGPCESAVCRLAESAARAGAQGVVCSALEIEMVREVFPEGVLMVPGIRPAGAALDDQSRVATPAGAVARGADHLVIGRPITRADEPRAAAEAIARELAEA
ncbi:hypothetical protein ABI59_01905 [Acidobacteria bacterium Mor1]|nr:hypothetical protein ABI59_01905 [Acidobacteria bacterium Mor1]